MPDNNEKPVYMQMKFKITKEGKERLILVLVNEERTKYGLLPLDKLPDRKDAATARLAELVALLCRAIETEWEELR